MHRLACNSERFGGKVTLVLKSQLINLLVYLHLEGMALISLCSHGSVFSFVQSNHGACCALARLMLTARFVTCFLWISTNVSGERPNYAEAWLVNILVQKVHSLFIFLDGKFHLQLFPCKVRNLSKKQKTFGLFVAAVLSAAKPMRLIRPSKALGIHTWRWIRKNHVKKSLNFYSFYSLYYYLIIFNLNGLAFCHRRSFVLGRWKKLSLRAACNGGARPGSV